MSANEPMPDERLANIGKALVVADGPIIAHELYDEVQRLRGVEAELAAQRDEWHRQNGLLRGERDRARAVVEQVQADRERLNTISAGIDQQKDKLITALQIDAAEQRTRAETAERELAEVRGRLGNATVEWSVRYREDGDVSTRRHTEAEARQRAAANPKTMTLVSALVGEWQEVADDGQ